MASERLVHRPPVRAPDWYRNRRSEEVSWWGCLISYFLSGDQLHHSWDCFTHQCFGVIPRLCSRVCWSRSEQQNWLVWRLCQPARECHHGIPECQRYSDFICQSCSYIIPSYFYAIAPCPIIESMAMGKLHKDIGHLIMQSAEDPEKSESQVVKVRHPKCTCADILKRLSLTWRHHCDSQDISVKTKEILANLLALADQCEDSKITLESLKQHHFPPVTENFLFHLAAAEQLLRI